MAAVQVFKRRERQLRRGNELLVRGLTRNFDLV
jgi:hypothetical protein